MEGHGEVCVVCDHMMTPASGCVVVSGEWEGSLLDLPSNVGSVEDGGGTVFKSVLAH